MDLVSSVKKIVCVMSLVDKNGQFKLKKNVDIPITGPNCVSILITDHGVFEFKNGTVLLKEISKTSSVDRIRSMTDVDLTIPANIPWMEDNFSKYAGPL